MRYRTLVASIGVLTLGGWAATTEPGPAAETNGEPQSSLRQFGVTWTFDKAYPTGRFVNGDPWVVGPVRIVAIDPPARRLDDGRTVNGAMVNPIVSGDTGFDSLGAKKFYRQELNVALGIGEGKPLVLPPGSSLLSAISRLDGDAKRPLETIAVLTVLDAPPPLDAFRPPYAAGDKTVRYRAAQLDLEKLPRLALVGTPPAWEDVERLVERPFVDFAPNWNRYHLSTQHNGELYGRDTSLQVGRVTAMLVADNPPDRKRKAAIGLVQRGIDLYGLFQDWNTHRDQRTFPWRSDGGHSSGRKWPIVFAGAMLGDTNLLHIGRTAPDQFHEDAQTIYVSPQHVALSHSAQWSPPYGGKRGQQPYDAAMVGMPEWVGNREPEKANAHWTGHPYRRGANQAPFYGITLGALAMGLREAWGHDAWFDYQARYAAIMSNEPDPFAALLGYAPVAGSTPAEPWEGWQTHWRDPWQYELWRKHWPTLYKLPTRDQLLNAAGTAPDEAQP